MKKRGPMIVLLCFILIYTFSTVWIMWDYTRQSQQDAMQEIFSHMTRNALEQTALLNEHISGQYAVLNAFAGVLEEADPGREEQIEGLQLLTERGNFRKAALVSESGEALFQDGSQADLSGYFPYQDVETAEDGLMGMVNKNEIFSVDSVALAVPAGNGRLLVGFFAVDDLRIEMDVNRFGDSAYSFVTDKRGNILIGVGSSNFLSAYRNVLDFYRNAILEHGVTTQQIEENLTAGTSGTLSFRYGNQARYVAYTPINSHKWFMFTSATRQFAEAELQTQNDKLWRLYAEMTVLHAVAMGALLIGYSYINRKLKEEQVKNERALEVLNTLDDLSDSVQFRADTDTWNLRFNGNYEKYFRRKPPFENVNDLLRPQIEGIPQEDMQALNKLGKAMLRFVPRGKGAFRLPIGDISQAWFLLEFVTLYDSRNKPYSIVGHLMNIEDETRAFRVRSRTGPDPLTHLMGHDAFHAQAAAYLAGDGGKEDCALLVVDIDDFSEIENRHGPKASEGLLVALGNILRSEFRESDLIARISGDEFNVLVRDLPEDDWLEKKAISVCENLREHTGREDYTMSATCSIGIAVRHSGEQADFDRMMKRANKALYSAKLNGRNYYSVYDEMTHTADQPANADSAEHALIVCLNRLIAAENLEKALSETLAGIGNYYQADCALVMEIESGGDQASRLAVWRSREAPQESRMEPALPITPDNLLGRVRDTRKLVTVGEVAPDTVPDTAERELFMRKRIRNLFLEPVLWQEEAVAFLCVENPRNRIGSAYLLKTVAGALWHEVLRRRDCQKYLAEEEKDHA